jgi:hypothetical protein
MEAVDLAWSAEERVQLVEKMAELARSERPNIVIGRSSRLPDE